MQTRNNRHKGNFSGILSPQKKEQTSYGSFFPCPQMDTFLKESTLADSQDKQQMVFVNEKTQFFSPKLSPIVNADTKKKIHTFMQTTKK